MPSAWIRVRALVERSRISRRFVLAAAVLAAAWCSAGNVLAAPQFATHGGPGTGSHLLHTRNSTSRTMGTVGSDFARRSDARRYQGFPAYTQTLRRRTR